MTDNKDGLIACRCSNCGAPIIIEEGQEYVTCEYCDTVFKVKTDKDRLIDMLVYGGTQYSAPQKRKGIAERTLEDKRKREEAKEREAAAERERQFRAEQAEKEREFRAEQAEIARKRDPGYILVQLLLWACFYPVMLLAVILKRLSEKNRNNELIAKGLSPKRVTEFPLLYMIVCGLIFFSIFSGFLFTPSGYSSNSSNITTEPTVTPASEWYEQEPMEFRDTSFTEEALIDRIDEFEYRIPKSWRVVEKEGTKYYYPFGKNSKTFLGISVWINQKVDENYYDDLSTEEFKYLIKADYNSLEKGGSIKNSKAYPCTTKYFRGLYVDGKIVLEETSKQGTILLTMLYTQNKYIYVSAIMADDENNITIDDYYAVLNSFEFAN